MIWSKCLKRLQSEVSAQEIDIWLRPLKVIEELNSINIIAPNDIIMDRINDNYLKLLKLALNDISDIDYEITVSYPISPFTQNNHNQKKSDGFPSLPSNIDKTFKGRSQMSISCAETSDCRRLRHLLQIILN